MKGILVCGELKEGKITSVSYELVTSGKKLSSILNQPLNFLLIGEGIASAADKAAHLGVDRVLSRRINDGVIVKIPLPSIDVS